MAEKQKLGIIEEHSKKLETLRQERQALRKDLYKDLDDAEVTLNQAPDDLLALDDALTKLARENQAAADLAKLHLFAGLTVAEAAQHLGVSRRTGFHRWTYARAFLQIEMKGG